MSREEFDQIVDRLKANYPVTEAQLKLAVFYAAERFEKPVHDKRLMVVR